MWYMPSSVARETVEYCIIDFQEQNPGLAGCSLDYIRTDGITTDIDYDAVSAFVRELHARMPGVDLEMCSLGMKANSQDGVLWMNSDWINTMKVMGYTGALHRKLAYLYDINPHNRRIYLGVGAMDDYQISSDIRETFIRNTAAGYRDFCLFDYGWWSGKAAIIDSLLDGSITFTKRDVSKIVNIPGTSFTLTIDDVEYETLASEISGLTTDGDVKAYVESQEGERAEIKYRVATGATLRIELGDYSD
jgi:hypothetical protein